MKVVFAFDRDFTVSTGGGPVPIEIVMVLAEKYPVYAIGNPMLVREAGIPYAKGMTKNERLRWILYQHPFADEYVVVDDIPIEESGWTYYKPEEFIKIYHKYL